MFLNVPSGRTFGCFGDEPVVNGSLQWHRLPSNTCVSPQQIGESLYLPISGPRLGKDAPASHPLVTWGSGQRLGGRV